MKTVSDALPLPRHFITSSELTEGQVASVQRALFTYRSYLGPTA